MSIDFNEIAKRALTQGHVDEPGEGDCSVEDAARYKKMHELDSVFCDVCNFAEDQGLNVGDILMVIATFFGKVMVMSVNDSQSAIRLFVELSKVVADAMAEAIKERNENE